jgi:hypothetical protein
MEENNKVKFLIHLRWYSAANYLIALGENITLWVFHYMTFFWIALALNVLTMIVIGMKIGKLENELSIKS